MGRSGSEKPCAPVIWRSFLPISVTGIESEGTTAQGAAAKDSAVNFLLDPMRFRNG